MTCQYISGSSPAPGEHRDISATNATTGSPSSHNDQSADESDLLRFRSIIYKQKRHGDTLLLSYPIQNHETVSAGNVVELTCQISSFKLNFLLVQHVIRTQFGGVLVAGTPIGRSRVMRSWLPPKPHEACLVFETVDGLTATTEQQALVEVPIDEVKRRQRVIFTNASYPSFRQEALQSNALICRWTCTLKYPKATGHAGTRQQARETVLQTIDPSQASTGYAVSNNKRRRDWRGIESIRGGTHRPVPTKDGIAVVILDDDDDHAMSATSDSESSANVWSHSIPGQMYTFGDMFCGAGGTSCGAQAAGFHVQLGCDADSMACATYRMNYPQAKLYHANVANLITSARRHRVDVLHLSPPCQFFSPAHTKPGQNDDMNTAALFACSDLVNKIRPRIFTLEQTFGITHGGHEMYMASLIRGFTEHGYSIRWGVVQLLGWGTCAQRRRLIIIGSCPGEALPTLPAPTHAASAVRGRQQRFITVADALCRPPPVMTALHDPHHEPRGMRRLNLAPWNPNQFLSKTITTGGTQGNDCHFSGTRKFTPREIAVLQGFPWTYKFSPKGVVKQAGNAFPPTAVKTLYMTLPGSHALPQIIVLDDDDEEAHVHHSDDEVIITDAWGREANGGRSSSCISSDDDDVIMVEDDDEDRLFSPVDDLSRESSLTLPELDQDEEPTLRTGFVVHQLSDGHDDLDMDVVEISTLRATHTT
ncbi:S-adenosyl-L-methionine-dependent methyltransferase [Microdochium trichocladiopsis]|uniref:DNA (cytosine-5-)-methyltransferase n=1 Tax=Microdochium trichocladiopsis TaxID=1682393 RepID=A0A9P8XS11_9PEZI|nr:S-adenosyl-L-methionine-dependent methyltransferase [Microdochium trichocladiopsis]KAH7014347.1 S-adenosyl-L-methionine-dependent methyltransferase [Microdochium trichocladiopsis]